MAREVRAGDGHPLRRYRWWQSFTRSLFHLRLTADDGSPHLWSVDVRHGGDDNGTVWAHLYRDGVHRARSRLPAAFDVPGGTIEVDSSEFGLRRCHYLARDGSARRLVPDPASPHARRARLDRTRPVLSRAVGLVSWAVLVVGVVVGLPQIAEQLTAIPPVAENVGSLTSPFDLPAWANVSLLLGTLVASTERALRLRYHWLLDGGLFGGE